MLISKRTKDISAIRFGALVAIRPSHTGAKNTLFWIFKCNCGKEHIARGNTIAYEAKKNPTSTTVPSCGCGNILAHTKHGYRAGSNTHPAYRAYRSMLSRCYSKTNSEYKWYGAKGVTVCNEWVDNPESFCRWAENNGWKKGLHLDKDILCNELNIYPAIYSPVTCQWVTAKRNVGFATNRNNFGKHLNIKLSHADVDEILALYASGKYSGPTLATRFNVSNSSIYRLISIARQLGS